MLQRAVQLTRTRSAPASRRVATLGTVPLMAGTDKGARDRSNCATVTYHAVPELQCRPRVLSLPDCLSDPMMIWPRCVFVALVLLAPSAAEAVQPVRMGSGAMTFDTVPGWGLRPDGSSAIGPTHGAVVVDKAGNIYTSADRGVYVFSPDGKVIHSFLDSDYHRLHDMEIREEDGEEFIYGARNANAEGIKFNVKTGEIVLRLKFPDESGLNLKKISPTAITVAPNGDIFLSDGYGSNTIFKYDSSGKYLSHFGKRGDGLQEFHTAHGMTLDTRYSPPRLLICDRNHVPQHFNDAKLTRGRLLHYDLDGNFIQVVATDSGCRRRFRFKETMCRYRTCMVGSSSSTKRTPSSPSWETIRTHRKGGAIRFLKTSGSKAFSVAHTDRIGMPTATCMSKIGMSRAHHETGTSSLNSVRVRPEVVRPYSGRTS